MTETEWLSATTLSEMLGTVERLRTTGYWRQCAFFVCGWVRLHWGDLIDERSRTAIEICELFQDGQADSRRLQEANLAAHVPAWELRGSDQNAADPELQRRLLLAAMDAAWVVSHDPFDCISELARSNQYRNQGRVEDSKLCDLLRDTFGNPFRPATLDPAWRTPRALALAGGMYDTRDFGAMPILADALQDAGCDSDDILGHCRGPGPHVRGCWVVDVVLGKE